jgi:serine/threonine protein kinase
MRLQPGAVIGSYHITAHIGSGGMGEVYRARDTKLQRDVAIKVLSDTVAADADRIARFEREALAVAALSTLHKELTPPQISGMRRCELSTTSDGRTVLFSYSRLLSSLYVVDGIK